MRDIKYRAYVKNTEIKSDGTRINPGIYDVLMIDFFMQEVTLSLSETILKDEPGLFEREGTSFDRSFHDVELLEYTGEHDKDNQENLRRRHSALEKSTG